MHVLQPDIVLPPPATARVERQNMIVQQPVVILGKTATRMDLRRLERSVDAHGAGVHHYDPGSLNGYAPVTSTLLASPQNCQGDSLMEREGVGLGRSKLRITLSVSLC